MYMRETTTQEGAPLLIREAEGNDAQTALEYVHQVSSESDYLTFGPGEFELTVPEEFDFLEKARHDDNSLYLLAFAGDRLAGTLTFSAGKRPRTRHIGEFGISVRQEFWGQGIASALIDCLLDWASRSHICKINLRVRIDNHRAIRLYERKGFSIEGILKKAMFTKGMFYDDLMMGREIVSL